MEPLSIAALSQETFDKVWIQANRKIRHGKKTFFAGILASHMGNLVFVMASLLAFIGCIHTWFPQYRAFLREIPLVIPAWQKFVQLCIPEGCSTQELVIRCLISIFAAALSVSTVITMLAYLVYHPFSKKQTGDRASDAKTMADNLNRVRSLIKRTRAGSGIYSVIFFLGLMLLISAYFLQLSADPARLSAFTEQLPDMFVLIIVSIALCFVILITMSVLLDTCSKLASLLYHCKIPYPLIAQAERFIMLSQIPLKELTEDQLAEKALTMGEAKRLLAAEQEHNGEYPRARQLFLEGAVCGDPESMDQCARLCILNANYEAAIFWLQKYVDSGKADDVAKNRLKQLKRGRKVQVQYHK